MSSTEPVSEIKPPTTAALAPLRGGAIVTPAVEAAAAKQAQDAYQELCRALLDEHDVQRIGDKDFRKKSAWRKLAVAFNVTNEIVSREYERDAQGRIIRAEVIDRATAPNGRHVDGLGACDLFEKCCVKATCRVRSQYHTHCDQMQTGCDGTRHFSNPQHDIPATAATRARNRACADLFGMGEVSAEEITNPERGDYNRGATGQQGEHDQRNWYEASGWDEETEERQAHQALLDKLRSLPEGAQKEFGRWRREEAKIDLQQPRTRDEHDKLMAKAEALANGEAPQPAAAAQEAEPKSAGGAEGGKQEEANPNLEPAGSASTQEVVDWANGLDRDGVDAALAHAEQETNGRLPDKRARLARYWIDLLETEADDQAEAKAEGDASPPEAG